MANPRFPFLIAGTCFDTDGTTPLTSTTVTALNETTRESITTTTNGSGQYIFDCANFTSGFTNGDYVSTTISGTGSIGENLVVRFTSHSTSQITYNEVDWVYV